MDSPSDMVNHSTGFPVNWTTEQDVRECIIRPLLLRLGFTDGTVTTERPLIYKRLFLGRKKGEKDRSLRGVADYVCDIDGRLRFVIEAKDPGEISQDEREQTYSYAAHPEIRAVLFAVISGSHFEIYRTSYQPENGPLLAFTYGQLESTFQTLANIVSPAAMRRDFPDVVVDVGVPLAPTLRSFAKVVRGRQTYTEMPGGMEARLGSTVHYVGGSLLRVDERIVLHLIPSHTAPVEQEFARAMAITELEFFTNEVTLSTDPVRPTVFTSTHQFAVQQGTPVPIPTLFNVASPAEASVSFPGSAKLTLFLDDTVLIGQVIAGPINDRGELLFRVAAKIELELA